MNRPSPSQQVYLGTFLINRYLNEEKQKIGGTGFLYTYNTNDGYEITVLVTAAHVLKGFNKANFKVATCGPNYEPIVEKPILINFTQKDVLYHPDENIDLCIVKIGKYINDYLDQGIKPYLRTWQSIGIPNVDFLNQLRWIEDVFFVGCPYSNYDEVNLLPVVRRATTATPLHIDYKGTPQFLIDAHIYKGSSGSPVCLINEGLVCLPGGQTSIGQVRTALLGILIEVINDPYDVEIGLGKCLKSQLLHDFLPLLLNV